MSMNPKTGRSVPDTATSSYLPAHSKEAPSPDNKARSPRHRNGSPVHEPFESATSSKLNWLTLALKETPDISIAH